MKLVLGMEVGLSPGDSVLDGDPVLFPPKGAESPSPIFGPFLLWPNSSMHQDATWYECWHQPKGLSVRWRPSLPPQQRGGHPLPKIFGPCFLWPNGWMDEADTWHGGIGLSPGEFVLDGDPGPFPKSGRAPPQF